MNDRPQAENWYMRLVGSTRGRIVGLLRRSERTVSELAAELSITGNAVRDHLAVLGRERLVEQRGLRRDTGGKPAHLYGLTPAAERLFPKAYAAVLGGVLTSLSRRLETGELRALLGEVGRDIAESLDGAEDGDLVSRTRTAAEILEGLGGATRVEEDESGLFIRSSSCPLDSLVDDHPELCGLAVALVSAVVGRDVTECCDRSAPRCAFQIAAGPVRSHPA